MGDEQQFCLRWNNFQANITTQFEALRDEEDFVDVTLACEGQRIKAHKVVLSACSPYFKELFRSNPCKHPILFMRDVEFRHLQSLIEFMYAGEVNVAQAHLSSFLRTAESLQIRGLTEAPQRHKQDPKDKTQTDASSSSNALIQQLINNARPQSTSPRATSQNNTSSQEEEEDDDILSGSSSLSPPPAKRTREDEECAPHIHLPLTTSQPTDPAIPIQELEPRSYNKGLSPEICEPKIETPDYNSDGESKGNFLALDNSMIDNPFSTMHGSLDMLAGPSSQGFTGDPSQDAALAAHHQKLHSLDPRPCPICNRMYSNLSNLRQHVRLIHNPQTVACPLCSKPFKTKLYLKRHLMSFHELLWTSTAAGGNGKPGNANAVTTMTPTQGSGQFFSSPQALQSAQLPEDKGNFHSQSPNKCKEASQTAQQEYFQAPRSYQNAPLNGDQSYTPHPGGNNQELSTFSTTQASKDAEYQRNQDKSRFKPTESNSYISGIALENEFQSNYVANSDGMAAFANASNQKSTEFMSSMAHRKSVDTQVSYQSPESREATREGQTTYECSDTNRSHVKQVGHVIE